MRIGIIAAAHKKCSNDGCDDSHGGNGKRIENTRAAEETGYGCAERKRGNKRAHVRFEKIRAHTGDVTDIISHIVRNNGGITRVILRNAGFDLADKICAHVCRLGVNTAADSCEKRDGGCTERKSEKYVIIAGEYINHAAAQKT